MHEKEIAEITVLVDSLKGIVNLELETEVFNGGYLYIKLKDNMRTFFTTLYQSDCADLIGGVLVEELEKAIRNVRSRVQCEIKDTIMKKINSYVIKTGADTPW